MSVKKCAFILINISVIIWEACSLVLRFFHYESNMFLYFTVLSNLVALVVCAIACVIASKGKYPITLYSWATCLVTFTFVIMLVGASTVSGGYYAMFCIGSAMLNHLACPLAMLVNYFLFLPKDKNFDGYLLAIVFFLFYGTTMCLLNAFDVVKGPYFFFEVKKMGVGKTILILSILIAVATLTALTLYATKNREKKTTAVAS